MKTYEFKVPGSTETVLIEAETFHEALAKFKQMLKESGINE